MKYETTLELIVKQTEKYKDKVFAIFPVDNTRITYNDLLNFSLKYSNYFQENGIIKGSRVSILFPKCREFIFCLTGLLNIGAIVNPVDTDMIEEDASRNINRFKTNFIVFSPNLEEFISNLKNHIKDKNTSYIQLEHSKIGNKIQDDLSSSLSKEDKALCIFTSGTTGDPKGVICSHNNILNGASNLKTHNIGENDRLLSLTPLTGINGNIFSIWSPLYTGGSVVYYQEMFRSYRVFELLDKYKITWFNGVPTHYSLMVNIPVEKDEFNLSNLKFMRSASSPLLPSIQKDFEEIYQIPIIETMGITEMTGQITSNPIDKKIRKIGSVGKPVYTKIKIVDEKGKTLKPTFEGDILVSGKGLMVGYFDDEKTTNTAVKDGWLYTGDIGYLDKDGFLFVMGRKKDIIIVGGKNVSMREIEEVIISHNKVEEVVAFGVPDKIIGERIIAYVKPRKNMNIIEDELLDFCEKHLSSYKIPKEIKICQSFPRGGQDKILRSKVKDNYLEENIDE
jgi:long-chain acyl-CoA synthetase